MLLGRDREISLLVERLRARRPVALVGEAGIGKTALLRESADAAGLRPFLGGALATLSWLPFLALRRALASEIALDDVAAVAAHVEQEAGGGALLLDDLQWAARPTRDVVERLLGRLPLLVAVRAGEPETADVLGELESVGVEVVAVAPLDEEAAAALVKRVRPDLSGAATAWVLAQAAGNPLLLEELARTGEPSASLRLAIAARLRPLDPAARTALATLALAGRPLPVAVVGDQVEALLSASLAVVDETGASVRHALIADAAVDALADGERRAIHSRLARVVDAPGEAARHHVAAGEIDEAHEAATRAAAIAASVAERVAHLALAAATAPAERAHALRLEAAAAAIGVHQCASALSLLASFEPRTDEEAARVELVRSRALWEEGDLAAAREAVVRGLAVVPQGTDLEVTLAIDDARTMYLAGEADAAVEGARRALAAARRRAFDEPRAEAVLGSALYYVGGSRWPEHLAAAVAAARAAGDLETENLAANNLTTGAETYDPGLARRVATEMVERARELGLPSWEQQFGSLLVNLDMHAGRLVEASERGEELLRQPLPPRSREQISHALTVVAIDRGDFARARTLTDALLAGPLDENERPNVDWLVAERELWAGRARAALEVAAACVATRRPSSGRPFAEVTHAWACLELGREPPEASPPPPLPIVAGAPVEVAALRALYAGRYDDASARFDEAAELWGNLHVRGHLRCRFGAGEAVRRAGDMAEARRRLELVEQHAASCGFEPLVARIRRSLRLAGARRSAPRRSGGAGLTGREQEAMALVADGLSSPEIARRLGVGLPTVERLINSAVAKLGARTRAQAAALARRM